MAFVRGMTNVTLRQIAPLYGVRILAFAVVATVSRHGLTLADDSTSTTRPPLMNPFLLPCGAGVPGMKNSIVYPVLERWFCVGVAAEWVCFLSAESVLNVLLRLLLGGLLLCLLLLA